MLRKLIAVAITAGLGKKAYDMYQEKHAAAAAPKSEPAHESGSEPDKPAARKPRARKTAAKKAKPSA